MKNTFYTFLLVGLLPSIGIAQDQLYKKGQFSFHWGWNHAQYSKSDIHFKGDQFDFTLYDVYAHDRQTPFDVGIYFNPVAISIPQTNFRFGYFINDHWQVNIGVDHMKYIMSNFQTTNITGQINNSGTIYDGNYNNEPIVLLEDFLTFEHTDGLNYVSLGASYFNDLELINTLLKEWNISTYFTTGADAGFLFPKTNARILNNDRHDDFHVAGYGLGTNIGLHINFFKYVYLEGNLKGGFIHMPDIKITSNALDQASQHFFFLQQNICIGVTFLI